MSANSRNTYTVKQVAKLSGVSIKALRFYDEIGLLKPAYYGENGYRYYKKEQLLALQQILFYRELGLELAKIQEILARPDFDKAAALKSHREQLVKDLERTKVLISTIDKTLAHLEKEAPMKAHEIYKGFDAKKLEEYVQWTRNRFGNKAAESYKQSMLDWKAKNPNWPAEEAEKVKKAYDELYSEFTECLKEGLPADSAKVQNLVARHYQVVLQFWTPNRGSYISLGQIYCEHPDYRKLYDVYHPRLAEYLSDAIRVFAESKL